MSSNLTEVMPDIVSLLKAYRAGVLSPVDVVHKAIGQAEACQASLNAFTTIRDEDALAEAQAAERSYARGDVEKPLAGIPITVKDILATQNIRTTMGSPTFAAHMPARDVASVQRLRAAGAIIIGKTTTPEFACKQTTNATLSGVTRNPWNLELTPGGSSGGSSASLAAGIGQVSLVTDGGGSARLPAACTGVVGFKPTLGLIPFETSSDAFAGLAHMGLMARNVEDIAAVLPVVAGDHPHDPHSLRRPVPVAFERQDAGHLLAGIKVGWRERLGAEQISKTVLRCTAAAVKTLEALGATVEVVAGEIERPLPIWQVLQHVNWSERYASRDPSLPPIDPVIANGIAHAETLSARDMQAALNGKTRLFRQVQSWFGRFDVVVTPTLTRGPLDAAHPGSGGIEVDGVAAGDIRAAWAPMLGLFTMTGHPAISLNCGWTEDGLPIGLQLVGRWHHDCQLLDVAHLLQNHMPHAAWRMPPISAPFGHAVE